jgi:hypothetical protein
MRDGLRRLAAGRRDFVRLYKTHNDIFESCNRFFDDFGGLESRILTTLKAPKLVKTRLPKAPKLVKTRLPKAPKRQKMALFNRKMATFRGFQGLQRRHRVKF